MLSVLSALLSAVRRRCRVQPLTMIFTSLGRSNGISISNERCYSLFGYNQTTGNWIEIDHELLHPRRLRSRWRHPAGE
jgi:hypothetical protein